MIYGKLKTFGIRKFIILIINILLYFASYNGFLSLIPSKIVCQQD